MVGQQKMKGILLPWKMLMSTKEAIWRNQVGGIGNNFQIHHVIPLLLFVGGGKGLTMHVGCGKYGYMPN
jgi:hypothetical protein